MAFSFENPSVHRLGRRTRTIIGGASSVALLVGGVAVLPAKAGTTTVSSAATEDSYVMSSKPTLVSGNSPALKVGRAKPIIHSYVKFNPTVPGTVSKATLRLHAASNSAGGIGVSSTSTAWSESTLNWNNRPAIGTTVSSSNALVAGTWTTVDVTALVKGSGAMAFAITTPGSNRITLSSSETSFAPQLIVEAVSSTTTTTAAPGTTTTTAQPTPTTTGPTTTIPPTSPTTTPPTSGCNTQESTSCTAGNSSGGVFRETFNGGATGPASVVNKLNRFFAFPFLARPGLKMATMDAQHGSDCAAPPATHSISSLDSTIFLCRDHLMTAIECCVEIEADAVVTLQPNHMVDLTKGEASVKVDVSTLSPSGGDWWEIWISPFEDHLAAPTDHWFHQAGAPRNALQFNVSDMSPESKLFGWSLFKDFTKVDGAGMRDPGGNPGKNIRQLVSFSNTRRDTYEIRLTKTHVQMLVRNSADGLMTLVDEFDVPGGFPADQAVVQVMQSNYRPRGNGGMPTAEVTSAATWHWDNLEISPAVPYTIINANEMAARQVSSESPNQRVTFKAPAPADARLRFRAWEFNNQPRVSFDNGATWQVATPVRPHNDPPNVGMGGTPDVLTYSLPIPAGTTAALVNGHGPCFDGTCEDALWSWNMDGFHIVSRAASAGTAAAEPTSVNASYTLQEDGGAAEPTLVKASYALQGDEGAAAAPSTETSAASEAGRSFTVLGCVVPDPRQAVLRKTSALLA